MASPFHISRHEQVELERNEAFRVMREQLRRQECETFRLHRDIIHTLLVPLFLINHQAERIAARTLPSQKGAEPERAFRGEARSAFSWLNCILTEEHDWYLTARCPACIVQHVLHSEPTIRFVTVASQLAGARSGFQCWLNALETAVCEDPFWGDAFWPDIEERASRLTDGVQQLVHQCYELSATLDNPVRVNPSLAKTPMPVYGSRSASCTIPLKPSSFARKQVRLTREEQRYRSSLMWNCSQDMTQPLAGCTTATQSRRRSLTS
ncbi:unnamed protein product [Penicillium glandicola]